MDAFDLALAQATGNTAANVDRIGNFTSSQIGALMKNGRDKVSFGKPALTYIDEKNFERKSKRPLKKESDARPLVWGKVCERYVTTALLSEEYTPMSQVTIGHPEIEFWKGSPDAMKANTAVEIKCPDTLKSFFQMVEAFEGGLMESDQIARFRDISDDTDKYYWQMVSNAILLNTEYAELITFCPYQSELDYIRAVASREAGLGDNTSWIVFAKDDTLPYVLDNGEYKNIYYFKFLVPKEDKELLTQRVQQARTLLINRKP
jgi:hypothetical protein